MKNKLTDDEKIYLERYAEKFFLTSKEEFNKLLMKNYTEAKKWKDSNPDLYANLK